ncbi:MAG: hypothetical protein JSS02_05650 [Planctomycetes bacterium]|nr:hypothetical protein [Planctomycetota bacterium]
MSAILTDASPESLRAIAQAAARISADFDGPQANTPKIGRESAEILVEAIDTQATGPVWPVSAPDGYQSALLPRARPLGIVWKNSELLPAEQVRSGLGSIWDFYFTAVRAGQKVRVSWSSPSKNRQESRLPKLCSHRPTAAGKPWLEFLKSASPADLGLGRAVRIDQIARRAGLLQWYDFLDESHQLSQSIEGEGDDLRGDYWHAIMHRREPDYSNAKYWFRRLGEPVQYAALACAARSILTSCNNSASDRWRDKLISDDQWNPFAFVDLCQACAQDETSDLAWAARRIQFAEMCLLLSFD